MAKKVKTKIAIPIIVTMIEPSILRLYRNSAKGPAALPVHGP